MILLCVRISCGDEVLYGPKWIGIEEDRTLCDLLRYTTGEQFIKRKIQVVVSSESSVREVSFVTLSVPVTLLEDKEKKIVSFLLQPKEEIFLKASCVDHAIALATLSNSCARHPTQSAHCSHYCTHPHPAYAIHQGLPCQLHYLPHNYTTAVHGHVPVSSRHTTMPCPLCIGIQEPLTPHGSPTEHVIPRYYGYPYYGHMLSAVGHGRPVLEQPMPVHGERFDTIVKGSPLYGQPPWWGWGSSDEETYPYPQPRCSSIVVPEGEESLASQRMVTLRKQKEIKNEETSDLRQERNTVGAVAIVEESQEKIFTQTEKLCHNPCQGQMVCKQAYLMSREVPGNNTQKELLAAEYEKSNGGRWEYLTHRNLVSDDMKEEDCDPLEDNVFDSTRQYRRSLSFEIPIIPEYGEIPEKPVNEKCHDQWKTLSKERTEKKIKIRRKTITKGKQTPMSGTETYLKSKHRAGRQNSGSSLVSDTSESGRQNSGSSLVSDTSESGRQNSGSSLVSDTSESGRQNSGSSLVSDTSESGCECCSRRRLNIPQVTSSNQVFGLTEVNLDQKSSQEKSLCHPLSPPMAVPKWVQQWAKAMQVKNGREKIRDSPTSDSTSKSQSSRPPRRGAMSRSNSAAAPATQHSVTKSATLPARAAHSRTLPLSRGCLSTGSDMDYKKTGQLHPAGIISSTSEDSDNEHSDMSFNDKHCRVVKGREEENIKNCGEMVPEKDGSGRERKFNHRPTSTPVTLPRGNKTTMLRAQSSRESMKSSSNLKATKSKQKQSSYSGSPALTEERGSSSHDMNSSSSTRIWAGSSKKTSRSPATNTVLCKASISSSNADDLLNMCITTATNTSDDTQAAVDALFSSVCLPDDLQMNRNDHVNKTFVLDDGLQQTDVLSSPEETTCSQLTSSVNAKKLEEEKNDTQEIRLSLDGGTCNTSLTSLQELDKSLWQTEKPFSLSVGSALSDVKHGDFLESCDKSRPVSPDSLVSLPPVSSPSPPSTPHSSAQRILQGKTNTWSAVLQSRRQWDVTDKPVEDLMLSSIHAFTVELRLASESALSKVKTLYEETASDAYPSTNSHVTLSSLNDKQEHLSSIPDWKSSHAEIAGVFRNLRQVEFSLRTMDQALSVLCSTPSNEANKERKSSMAEPNQSPHKWKYFKARARRYSWAVEHRDKFPEPPSDDEDTS